jgi:FKBP-type peptidyl-prolyl cis-trans isomerase
MKRFFAGIILASVAVAFFACGDDNSLEELRQNELETLDKFITEHYPNVDPKESGLYFIETIAGVGDSLKPGDRVQVFYSTWTIDSVLIDESQGYNEGHRFEPLEFIVSAGGVITGLDEAATYMQPGTISNLVLPSELAYGQNGSTGVAGFTTLLMEVEVYKVYPYPVADE